MIPYYGPDDIRPLLSIETLIPSAEAAFRAIADGTSQTPTYVLHPNELADIHVKSAALRGSPIFTVKMAGWSQVLANRGAQASTGMIVVFDSETCKPLAVLQDDHLVSDFRTAAAGAVVANLLAPAEAKSALIVGTGVQALLQAEALLLVCPIAHLKIWGRSAAKVSTITQDLRAKFPGITICPAEDLPSAIADVEIVVTATGARDPVIMADWVKPGQHITSVGSDDTTKCEIDPSLLRNADVYVDAVVSAAKYGPPARAIAKGLLTEEKLTQIGSLRSKQARPRSNVTIACLSGLGVQDLTAVNAFWPQLQRLDRKHQCNPT